MQDDKKKKASYFLKDSTRCPVCEEQFNREEMLTGRGRLISRDINKELRRTYDENPKFGKIYPQAYSLNVCPNCWYTALPADFPKLPKENIPLIRDMEDYRRQMIEEIFSPLVADFSEQRDLISGTASYLLALSTYSFFPPAFSPSLKRSVFSLRGAWLMGDMAEEFPEYKEKFWKIQEILYLKAHKFYNLSYDLVSKNKENIEGVNLGPDTDKNYGYDGFIYIYNYLNFTMSYKEDDIIKKAEIFSEIKRNISRIFGIGKSSKEKPGPLLHIVRNLYDEVSEQLEDIESTLEMGGSES